MPPLEDDNGTDQTVTKPEEDLREEMERPAGRSIGQRQEDMDRKESERIADKYDPEGTAPDRDEKIRAGMDQMAARHEDAAGASIGQDLDDPNQDINQELADWRRHDEAATQAAGESASELGDFGQSLSNAGSEAASGNLAGAAKDGVESGEHLKDSYDAREEMLEEREQADSIRSHWAQEEATLEHQKEGLENIENANLDEEQLRNELRGQVDGVDDMNEVDMRQALEDRIQEMQERMDKLHQALEQTQPRI